MRECTHSTQKQEEVKSLFILPPPLIPPPSELSFVDLASSEQKPVSRDLEILNQRNKPCYLEVPPAVINLLCVPMATVKAVGFTEASEATRNTLLIKQLLHHLEVSLLDIEGVLFIGSRSTHYVRYRNLSVLMCFLGVLTLQ